MRLALVKVRTHGHGRDAEAFGTHVQEVGQRGDRSGGVRVESFKKLKHIVGVTVNDVHTDRGVTVVGQ